MTDVLLSIRLIDLFILPRIINLILTLGLIHSDRQMIDIAN